MSDIINIYCIYAFSFMLLIIWFVLMVMKKRVIITPVFLWMLIGTIVLSIPLLYTSPLRFPNALWRVLGLTFGVFCLFSLQQINYKQSHLFLILHTLLAVVVIEVFIAYQQVFNPYNSLIPLYGNRAYGTFFQPNVFASFIATGLAIVLILLFNQCSSIFQRRIQVVRKIFLIALLVMLLALLVITQSRTGWVGAGLVIVLILFVFWKTNKKETLIAAMSMFLGIILGMVVIFLSNLSTVKIRQDNTNNSRWSMLVDTFNMILEKPISGWGYGGFEYDLAHYRIAQTPLKEVTEITRHPHNEILLWVVEGGIVGVFGVLIIIFGILFLLIQIKRNNFKNSNNKTSKALVIALIPIFLHTQLEFPFYISSLHSIIFVLFVAMIDRTSVDVSVCHYCPPIITKAMIAISVCLFIMVGYYLKGSEALLIVERFRMEDVTELKEMPEISRVLHREKVDYYESVNYLLKYNLDKNEWFLDVYSKWAKKYLMVHIDKNVYASLISILIYQKKFDEAEEYRRKAELFFPSVKVFSSVVFKS